jgi:hypothetical protein
VGASIRLEWQRDSGGYDLEDRPDKPCTSFLADLAGKGGKFVVPRGGKRETYVVEGLGHRIFEALAKTHQSPDGVLAFVNEWGLLEQGPNQEVSEFYEHIEDLRQLLDVAALNNFRLLERYINQKGIGPMNLRFGRLRGDSAPRIFVEPRSLWLFCCCEVMQVVAAGAILRNCINCGAFFTLGTKQGTRSTRQYCSDRCRVAMHRKGKQRRMKRHVAR